MTRVAGREPPPGRACRPSVTESAFPANIISTPKIFPINRRDPLAAAALVLLVGVSRELFKVWRRRATDYWPA